MSLERIGMDRPWKKSSMGQNDESVADLILIVVSLAALHLGAS